MGGVHKFGWVFEALLGSVSVAKGGWFTRDLPGCWEGRGGGVPGGGFVWRDFLGGWGGEHFYVVLVKPYLGGGIFAGFYFCVRGKLGSPKGFWASPLGGGGALEKGGGDLPGGGKRGKIFLGVVLGVLSLEGGS